MQIKVKVNLFSPKKGVLILLEGWGRGILSTPHTGRRGLMLNIPIRQVLPQHDNTSVGRCERYRCILHSSLWCSANMPPSALWGGTTLSLFVWRMAICIAWAEC